jgi:predicted Zn-dependent peptidase
MRRLPLLAALLLPALALAQPKAPPRKAPKPSEPPKSHGDLKTPIASPAAAPPATLAIPVRKAKLDNGLRVVLWPDPATPTVAVDVVYDVGGRNELRGRSGFAHLFEHMMFQGSQNVPRGEHFKLVTSHGGSLNGTTSEDRTNYFEMLPRAELPLALWLEADRMKSLDVSQTNFENQRAVVKEEYRMRVENVPYRLAEIRLKEMVYEGYWPYEHTPIGTMADLDAAQIDWVREFHDAYYAPNNAVLAIAGDFDPDEALALVRKFFGDAKPQPNVPAFDPPKMPAQTAPREAIVEDLHARLPAVLMGWPIPPTRDKEHYALELAAGILADGESSRLVKLLVKDRAIATDVSAGTGDLRGPDWLALTVKVASSAKPADADKLVLAEIAKLAKDGPTDAEMEKVRTRTRAHFLLGLQSNYARAQRIAEYELYWGDAGLLAGELDAYLAVGKEDVRNAVAKHLVPSRRSKVEVKPAPAPKGAPGEGPKEPPKKDAPKKGAPKKEAK